MEGFDTQTVIALCALMAVLFSLIQLSVWPIKKNQDRFDGELKELKAGQAKMLADIAEIKRLISAKA